MNSPASNNHGWGDSPFGDSAHGYSDSSIEQPMRGQYGNNSFKKGLKGKGGKRYNAPQSQEKRGRDSSLSAFWFFTLPPVTPPVSPPTTSPPTMSRSKPVPSLGFSPFPYPMSNGVHPYPPPNTFWFFTLLPCYSTRFTTNHVTSNHVILQTYTWPWLLTLLLPHGQCFLPLPPPNAF
jgi:hypothetical protein